MLYGIGNNITGTLVPSGAPQIRAFTPISTDSDLVFHGWTCTLTRGGGWGDGFVRPTHGMVLGEAEGVLEGRRVGLWTEPTGMETAPAEGGEWDDAAACSLGALGWRSGTRELVFFRSLGELAASSGRIPLEHPLRDARVYATDARFLVAGSSSGGVFEVSFDRKTGEPVMTAIDELAGLGVQRVDGGGGRFGVVTDAGEGYILDSGVELVDLEDVGLGDAEVQDIALGDEFEVVLVDGRVYARGDNTFGQLGPLGERVEEWTEMETPGRVQRVWAGRFSVVVSVP